MCDNTSYQARLNQSQAFKPSNTLNEIIEISDDDTDEILTEETEEISLDEEPNSDDKEFIANEISDEDVIEVSTYMNCKELGKLFKRSVQGDVDISSMKFCENLYTKENRNTRWWQVSYSEFK